MGRVSTDQAAAGDEPARHGQQEPLPSPAGAVRAVPLSLEAVQADDETGASTRVIAVLAVLAAAGVRREMLHAAGQAGVLTSGRRMTAAAVDDVLAGLAERSLLTTNPDDRIGVPRLVAAQARSWLAGQGQLVTACQAAAGRRGRRVADGGPGADAGS